MKYLKQNNFFSQIYNIVFLHTHFVWLLCAAFNFNWEREREWFVLESFAFAFLCEVESYAINNPVVCLNLVERRNKKKSMKNSNCLLLNKALKIATSSIAGLYFLFPRHTIFRLFLLCCVFFLYLEFHFKRKTNT